MEDYNNIEHDPIPEGLEFNESYMQEAFAMYDAAKQKRKRRLLIWWLTSATGFAAVILLGLLSLFGKADKSDKQNPISTDSKRTHMTQSDKNVASNPLKNSNSSSKNNFVESEKQIAKSNIPFEEKSNPTQQSNTSNYNNTKNTRPKKWKSESKTNQPLFSLNNGTNLSPSVITNPTPPIEPLSENRIGKALKKSLIQTRVTLPDLNKKQVATTSDTSSEVISNSNHPHVTASLFRNHQLYLNLGVNTLFGMTELKNRVTFRESIGVSYNYQIRPKWSIGAGLEYHSISRISYKRKVGDTLNSDNTTTILNKTTLNYISLFPEVRYQLAAKHQFTAGLGVEYLLTDPGERYEIQNFTTEDPKRSNSQLYYSTFNRFNFSASVGYSYQFSKFMSAHALYHFGFTDITKNNSLNATLDRNSRLQLMLKIRLY